MTTLRQRLYKLRSIQDLSYRALLGQLSGTDTNPDVSYKVVFGDTGSLAADTEQEIWPLTTAMGCPDSAEVLDIVSSSTQDDSGGTGIDAVYIEGLDGDYLPQQELVTLNGTGTVNSSLSYVHIYEINCLNITTTGTTNAGNITVTNTTSGDTLGYVLAGDSLSKHSQFVVPAGYNALILSSHTSCFRTAGSGEKRCQIDLTVTPLDGGAGDGIEYKTLKTGVSSAGVAEVEFHLPLVIGQKVLIHPKAQAETVNTKATIQYEFILVKETLDIDSVF